MALVLNCPRRWCARLTDPYQVPARSCLWKRHLSKSALGTGTRLLGGAGGRCPGPCLLVEKRPA